MAQHQIYSDRDIAEALRACEGSVLRAAKWLGCSPLTVRNRVARNEELRRLRVPGRAGRPSSSFEAARIVSDEQLIAALDGAASVKAAAHSLGIARQTFLSRACSPDVAAALSRCEVRSRALQRQRVDARLAARRAAVAEALERDEEHRQVIDEMRASWQRARDTWVAEARARGLSLKDMGLILGITRERVRQIEEMLGMRARTGRKSRAA